MKTNTLLKTITVAGAVAATLTLSACDMHISFGSEDTRQGETAANPEEAGTEPTEETAAEEPAPASDSGQDSTTSSGGSTDSGSATSASDSGSSSSGSSSNGSSSSGSRSTTENDGYEGPRIGEDGVELDRDGNGKIPADVLEADIVDAYAKQGTTVDNVDCYSDLRIYSHRGSQSCTVKAAGQNHYGTVKITSASQSGIGYSLEFPNI